MPSVTPAPGFGYTRPARRHRRSPRDPDGYPELGGYGRSARPRGRVASSTKRPRGVLCCQSQLPAFSDRDTDRAATPTEKPLAAGVAGCPVSRDHDDELGTRKRRMNAQEATGAFGASTAYRNSGASGPYAPDGRYPLFQARSQRQGSATDLRRAGLVREVWDASVSKPPGYRGAGTLLHEKLGSVEIVGSETFGIPRKTLGHRAWTPYGPMASLTDGDSC